MPAIRFRWTLKAQGGTGKALVGLQIAGHGLCYHAVRKRWPRCRLVPVAGRHFGFQIVAHKLLIEARLFVAATARTSDAAIINLEKPVIS